MNQPRITSLYWWGIFCLIVVLFAAQVGEFQAASRGPFGDQFGLSTTIFAGLSVALIAYAVQVQRYEVSKLIEELSYNKKIFESQKIALDKQNFESTYFRMLANFDQIQSSVDITLIRPNGSTGDALKSRDAFDMWERLFAKKLRENENKWSRFSSELEFKRPIIGNMRYPKIESEFQPKYTSRYVSDCFSEFIKEEGRDLLPYFRLLFNIYHFIGTKADEEAIFYATFIRARLSEPELSLIFYYGASIYGMPISKTLMERFCILEYMRADRVFSEESLEKFDLTAFGRNSEVYGVFGKKIRSWQTANL